MENRIKLKYRAKELAEYLGIGLSTVWKWAKEGKIKPHIISRGVTVYDIEEALVDLGMKEELSR